MSSFQANQIQLAGPVPDSLYHRYVEFRPFVQGMFTSKSLRGRILNHALHHQHARIYNYDKTTKYGSFPGPSEDLTRQFLDMVHFDRGGRIYTYIIMLDGQWRFTETGKEFSIDLLSKHTMHSDVSIYIAFSGEFFIRRLKHSHKDMEDQKPPPPDKLPNGPPDGEAPSDPTYYQLVIDNDSGTYRPNAKLLTELKAFLEHSLPGLHITTLDCSGDKEKMEKWKDQQRERRRKEGASVVVVQQSDVSSISSSDEEDLDDAEAAGNGMPRGKMEKLGARIRKPKEKMKHWVGRRKAG